MSLFSCGVHLCLIWSLVSFLSYVFCLPFLLLYLSLVWPFSSFLTRVFYLCYFSCYVCRGLLTTYLPLQLCFVNTCSSFHFFVSTGHLFPCNLYFLFLPVLITRLSLLAVFLSPSCVLSASPITSVSVCSDLFSFSLVFCVFILVCRRLLSIRFLPPVSTFSCLWCSSHHGTKQRNKHGKHSSNTNTI